MLSCDSSQAGPNRNGPAMKEAAAAPAAPVIKAIALSLAGIFLLDSMGAIIKHLGSAYPAQQLSAFRNLFGLVPSLLVLVAAPGWRAGGRPLKLRQWRLALARGLFVTFAQFCFYLSLVHLAFATASTLAFAGPLFVTALSLPLLGDRVGPWRWTAVAVGFAGVVLIMQPGSDLFTSWSLLPVGAALGYALSAITVRLITEPVPSALINLYSTGGAVAGSSLLMLSTSGYHPVATVVDWLWIVAMGTLGGCGVLLLVIAYRLVKPSILAPFEYFAILFAFALGWMFFGEAPFATLFPGVLLIVAGGFLIIWRERRRAS